MLLERVESYKDALDLLVYSHLSVLQGNNVNESTGIFINALPEGPQYYPADQITDHPENLLYQN